MNKSRLLSGALAIALAGGLAGWFADSHMRSSAALAATDSVSNAGGGAVAAVDRGTLAIVDHALTGPGGPAGPDDEGQYRLIDPIGPGGTTSSDASNEVFSPTMIGGVYTKWIPYHDPFSAGGAYEHRDFGEFRQ